MMFNAFLNALFFLALLLFLPACSDNGADEPETALRAGGPAAEANPLILGLVPEINIFEQRRRYLPLTEYLSLKTNRPVRIKIVEGYDRVVESFTENLIDMAFVGSLDKVLIDSVCGCDVVARPMWENGVSTYSGLIFARRDSGVTAEIGTWKGKKIALVHKFTTAGYIFQRQYLAGKGVEDFEGYFSDILYTGSHDAAIRAVLKGEAEIGGAKDLVFKRMAAEDREVGEGIVILAESKRVPSNGLVISRKVDEETRKLLKRFLLDMDKDPAAADVLKRFGARRFLDTTDDDYRPVMDMLEGAGLTPGKLLEEMKKSARLHGVR